MKGSARRARTSPIRLYRQAYYNMKEGVKRITDRDRVAGQWGSALGLRLQPFWPRM
jgi:predicted alternative tryptophan synthase beta-subunit